MVVVRRWDSVRAPRADQPLLDIYATMIVGRDSQKGIMIGHRGSRLSEICAAAPHQIEAVAMDPGLSRSAGEGARGMATRPQHLNRLGF
jgi:GTP-binding protein Era